MPSYPGLTITKATHKRSYTFPLKDENGQDRDIEDQIVKVMLVDIWNQKVYLNMLAEHITENPAEVKIEPEMVDLPAEGAYDVLVAIGEITITPDPPDPDIVTVDYSEPYKIFDGYVRQSAEIDFS